MTTPSVKLRKVAVRRDPEVPAGQPAAMFIVCPCGGAVQQMRIAVEYPNGQDVECPRCHSRYTASGWMTAGGWMIHL